MKDNRTLAQVAENFGVNEGWDWQDIGDGWEFVVAPAYANKPAKQKAGKRRRSKSGGQIEWFVNKGKVSLLDSRGLSGNEEKKIEIAIAKRIGL